MRLLRALNVHGAKIRWTSAAVILASAIAVLRILPLERAVDLLERTVSDLGLLGPLVFALSYVLGALAFVPGSLLTLAAGALFGLWAGTAVVSAASTSTAAAAFLIARYLARRKVSEAAARYPRFHAIDEAIAKGGWKIVGLLRLSPAVPFSLGNYLFGLTRIRFWPYVLTSFLAMLPGTFMYVYLGYAGRAGAQAAAGGAARSPLEWTLLAVGLTATAALTYYVTRLARREIRAHTNIDEVTAKPPPEERPAAAAPPVPWKSLAAAGAALLSLAGALWVYQNRARVEFLFGPP